MTDGGVSFALARLRILGDLPLETLDQELPAVIAREGTTVTFSPERRELFLVAQDAIQRDRTVTEIRRVVETRGGSVEFGSSMCIRAAPSCADCDCLPPVNAPVEQTVIVREPAMREVFRVVERVARSSVNVLVLGETGSGKELVADAVHRASPRAPHPLVRVNCAALPESLVEAHLFGHEQGAFTGAVGESRGLIQSADHGTVFLDEVGELTPATQAKLLRVIEQRELFRVGATRPVSVDVRFVAATNRDLDDEVRCGRFREDLYFRLSGVRIRVPPLRERRSEILPLAELFLRNECCALGRSVPVLSEATRRALLGHPWRGNVRELKNAVQHAALIAVGDTVEIEHLSLEPGQVVVREAPAAGRRTAPVEPAGPEDRLLRERVISALDACAGNQTRAAEHLGVSRQTLIRWLTKLEIKRPRKPEDL